MHSGGLARGGSGGLLLLQLFGCFRRRSETHAHTVLQRAPKEAGNGWLTRWATVEAGGAVGGRALLQERCLRQCSESS
jgi:hypothetical protein